MEGDTLLQLKQAIHKWLETHLSHRLADKQGRQGLLYSAGLSSVCDDILLEGKTIDFIPALVERLFAYGTIRENGCHAMAAFLDAGKNSTGREGQAECETLLNRIRVYQAASSSQACASPTATHLEESRQEILEIQNVRGIERSIERWLEFEKEHLIRRAIEEAGQEYSEEISTNHFFEADMHARIEWILACFKLATDCLSPKHFLRADDPVILSQPYNKAIESICNQIEQAQKTNDLSAEEAQRLLENVKALKTLTIN